MGFDDSVCLIKVNYRTSFAIGCFNRLFIFHVILRLF